MARYIRYIRYAFLALVTVVLVTLALANSAPVTLRALPEQLTLLTGWNWSATLPLWVVIFGGVVAGLFIGFVWEWLREHRYRAQAARERRERERLEREVARARREAAGGDEVLALLEEGGKA
ncbi:Protein of unknown function [Meinhardsimonia xiamenensis]|jgi:uncharacterized integral membrane protein|uniref:Lipopolysaccharide assembly protein A domain-containing protein n=1 Tax=Meinhardsimonia xiamenensis TaxID=990712 RepID=A0A1G8Z5U9_9RHOB|nr:lipopolysaccharide assembly protein LapA domain-containing protein [Meinhardsimonia xiamenensis]PRX37566.1 uncharacterized protein DUF1049 [Meinhardsimonia xiamenensis]SDK10398.1 Protein of unknown function [Meinhardsimonia xiamenensis]